MQKRLLIYKVVGKVNHGIYKHEIKIFHWNENEQEILIRIIRIYSQDIRMNVIKRGKEK